MNRLLYNPHVLLLMIVGSDQWLESICNKTQAAEMSLVNPSFLNSTVSKHQNLLSCQLYSENGRRITTGLTRHSATGRGQNKDSDSENSSGSHRGFTWKILISTWNIFGYVFSCHTGSTKSVYTQTCIYARRNYFLLQLSFWKHKVIF